MPVACFYFIFMYIIYIFHMHCFFVVIVLESTPFDPVRTAIPTGYLIKRYLGWVKLRIVLFFQNPRDYIHIDILGRDKATGRLFFCILKADFANSFSRSQNCRMEQNCRIIVTKEYILVFLEVSKNWLTRLTFLEHFFPYFSNP